MIVGDYSISQLWDMDTIGIRESVDGGLEKEEFRHVRSDFLNNITRSESGRYVVKMPWKSGHPPLPSNFSEAERRLIRTTKKLKADNLYDIYGNLFKAWEEEDFIEKVDDTVANGHVVHYIPHRAVVKPGSLTTPVRPVFDASCRIGKVPSLNDCLHKGENYIQLIPEILHRFREKKIGVVSDIRKAFQMIEVHPDDRNAMRFLWWDDDNKLMTYRHKRVMFGATCSPFILGAVLQHHLFNLEDYQEVGKKLFYSMYVDNCVSSEDTYEDYKSFRNVSTMLLAQCQMELRLWMTNIDEFEDENTHTISVLGLQWDRREDTLFVKIGEINIPERITKRVVLSMTQRIFDPIGVTSPSVISMKCLLQRVWINKLKWDESLPEDEANCFLKWVRKIELLQQIRIPRQMCTSTNREEWSIHTFTDASRLAYSCIVYLRVQHQEKVDVRLVAAKARVSPVKKTTIPRLELLGCLIGARICATFKKSLGIEGIPEFYWSDSTTALSWIRRDDNWGTFVGNRTAEINKLTKKSDWRHVPGLLNPADLPSRGCTPEQLLSSKYWEGPSWLYATDFNQTWEEEVNETEVAAERKKSVIPSKLVTMSVIELCNKRDFSFKSLVRIMAYAKRFIFNCRQQVKRTGKLSCNELTEAEEQIVKEIQHDSFAHEDLSRFKGLNVFVDADGMLRVRTRIILRKDFDFDSQPLLLPGKHPLVRKLIMECHLDYAHAGIGFLMTKLRRKYWILQARKSIRSVTSKCFRCRKMTAKPPVTQTAPLPLDRIKDADVFEVLGIYLAGPLILKNQKKVWLVIYTCAVYRAVHLDIVDSLSTRAFLKSLGKFIDKYGRPAKIYCDNGTNFRGSANLFRTLDWKSITKDDSVQPISFSFNCPGSPWWGGWWERLNRTLKDLLKRTVGKASLTHKELEETLKVIQEVMNNRPLTYVSENVDDLEPLTPSLFMRPPRVCRFPEGYLTEGKKMRIRYNYLKHLWGELKLRFQREYLSFLTCKSRKRPTRSLKEGELVVIANEQVKRIGWPLGRIIELIPGKDGISRVARVKTQDGELMRPVQRLHPLELDAESAEGHCMVTRSKKCAQL